MQHWRAGRVGKARASIAVLLDYWRERNRKLLAETSEDGDAQEANWTLRHLEIVAAAFKARS